LDAGLMFRRSSASERYCNWTVISKFSVVFFGLRVNAGVMFKINVALCVPLAVLQK
jgi:hypothetical protein